MLSNPVDIDDVRLSDLSPGGWFALAIATVGFGFGVFKLGRWAAVGGDLPFSVVLSGLAVVFGGTIAYQNARPECEAVCETCGEYIRAHSSRDGVDELVEVTAMGSPRRLSIGSLSVVVEPQVSEFVYCSGECAAVDERPMIEQHDAEKVPVTAGEVDA